MTLFNARFGLIIVQVTLVGPSGDTQANLALDTGASSTLISKEVLSSIGYDPDSLPKTVNFTTGSGVESASRVMVERLEALGQERPNFSVIAHTLPPTASIDGVLGLDFLRNHVLTLDFQRGAIALV